MDRGPGGSRTDLAQEHTLRRLPFALSFINGEGRLVLRDFARTPLHIRRLELRITGLTFPFDLTGGAASLRDRWMETVDLELTIALDDLHRALEGASAESEGLTDLALSIDRNALELVGRISGNPPGPWFVLRYEPDVLDGRDLIWRPALFLLLGPPVVSLPQLAVAVGRLVEPRLERQGLGLVVRDIPRRALKRVMLPAGYRLPDCRNLKLRALETSWNRLMLSFTLSESIPASLSTAAMSIGEIDALLAPGDEAVAQGDLERARRIYLGALGQEPGHPTIVCRLAWLDAVDPRRRISARAACHKALEHSSSDGVLSLLASLDLSDDDLGAAVERLRGLTDRLGPLGRSRLLLFLGVATTLQDPQRASVQLESALAYDPGLTEALEALRDLYAAEGRRDQLGWVGARLAEAALSPEARGRVLTELGQLFQTRFDDLAKATALYEEALLHWPESGRALFGLAECYSRGGDQRAALRCLDAVVQIAAERGDEQLEARAHVRAGEYWEELEDLNAAAVRFHHALEKDPSDRLALERAASVDVSLGRFQKAEASLRRLIRIAEDDQDRDLLRQTLLHLARLNLEHQGIAGVALVALDRLRAEFPEDREIREMERLAADLGSEPSPSRPPSKTPMNAYSVPRPRLSTVIPPPPSSQAPTTPTVSAEPRPATPPRPMDLEGALQAYLASPGDRELAADLIDRLERAGDWPRLIAVLAAQVEAAPNGSLRAELLASMARALDEGLGDRESAADTYLRAAEDASPELGATYARRAAELLEAAGYEGEASEAAALADQLDELADPHA